MPVDIWGFESHLYAIIDSSRINGKKIKELKFDLGEDNAVNITIESIGNNPLSNSTVFHSKEIKFKINFRNKKTFWFRVDNLNKDSKLHFHAEVNSKSADDHQPILFVGRLSELVSYACDKAEAFLKVKYPEINFNKFEGFGGFA